MRRQFQPPRLSPAAAVLNRPQHECVGCVYSRPNAPREHPFRPFFSATTQCSPSPSHGACKAASPGGSRTQPGGTARTFHRRSGPCFSRSRNKCIRQFITSLRGQAGHPARTWRGILPVTTPSNRYCELIELGGACANVACLAVWAFVTLAGLQPQRYPFSRTTPRCASMAAPTGSGPVCFSRPRISLRSQV